MVIHEFEKRIDNSRDRLSQESISFLKQDAGKIRSRQMLSWKDAMMKQEQYNDLLREAENGALVQQTLLKRKRRTPLVGRMLAALVRYANDLGCYLLEGYASALKVSVQTPCQDAGTNQSSYPERR